MTELGGEWIPVPGQGDRNHVLEFCEHGSTEDPVRLMLSSWGTSRMCMWPGHNGGVAQQRTQKQALRFEGDGWVSHRHLGAGTSVTMGPAWCSWGLTLWWPRLRSCQQTREPAGPGVYRWPTVTPPSPPLLGFGPRSPLSLGTSPLQQEQLGVRFWLFWFLAGLGIRKGNRATHTTPTPRTEPQAGKASSVCVHQRGQRPFHLTTLNTLYQNKSRVICKCLESICLFILLTPYSYWWEKNFY